MKRGLVPLLTIVLAPAVLAQDQGFFGNAFSLIFGYVSGSPSNDMVLKVGLWLALTMVLFQGAQKVFKTKDATGQEVGYKKLSIIFALIISTIAVRFMPPFISEGLGAMTWIAALILLPYTLVGFVTNNQWAKVIATVVFDIIIWGLFSSYSAPYIFPYIRGNNFLSDLVYMMKGRGWMIPVIALGVILILFFIFSAKGAPSPGGGGGSSKGGFWDWMSARKAAKAGIKQTRIESRANRKGQEAQARAAERQAIERRKSEQAHARAAVEQARIQAQPPAQQRKPGLMKNLFSKLGKGIIKNITTPKPVQVQVAEAKARAKRERDERERLATGAPSPKPKGWLERRRQARAARQAQQQAGTKPGLVERIGNRWNARQAAKAAKKHARLSGLPNVQPAQKFPPIKRASRLRRWLTRNIPGKTPEFQFPNQIPTQPQHPRNTAQQVNETLRRIEASGHPNSPQNIPLLGKLKPTQPKPYNRDASYEKAMRKIKQLEERSPFPNPREAQSIKSRRKLVKLGLGKIAWGKGDIETSKEIIKVKQLMFNARQKRLQLKHQRK